MSAPDVLWRLAEAYGELIGMGLGLILVEVVIAMILLHREIQWKDVVLGYQAVYYSWVSRYGCPTTSKLRSAEPFNQKLING